MRSRVMRDGSASAGIQLAPLQKMAHAVDLEDHRHASLVRLVDEAELAQADALHDAVAGDRDDGLVQRLLAIARPATTAPAVEIDRQRRLAAVLGADRDVGGDRLAGKGECHRNRRVPAGDKLDLGGHRHACRRRDDPGG